MGPQRIKKAKKDKNVFKKLEDAGGLSSWVQPGAKGKGSERKGFEEPEASNISSQLCLPRKKQSGGYKNKLLFQRLDDLNSYT